MSASFAIIGRIAFTTSEFVNNLRAQVKRYFIFKMEKFTKASHGTINNLDLTKRKIFVNTIL